MRPSPRLTRQHTINKIAKDSFDAMRWRGEATLVLHLFHASEGDTPNCPNCYNKIYKQVDTSAECSFCFGTGFVGGFKWGVRTYAMFTSSDKSESIAGRGEWNPDTTRVVFPSIIPVRQNDIIYRGSNWVGALPTKNVSVYRLGNVSPQTVRDGLVSPEQNRDINYESTATLLPEDDPWRKLLPLIQSSKVSPDRLYQVDSIQSALMNQRFIDQVQSLTSGVGNPWGAQG